MASGLQSFECERCGAPLDAAPAGAVARCGHCSHECVIGAKTEASTQTVSTGAAPRPAAAGRSRASLFILVGFGVLGLVIAIGGASAILLLRARAPSDSYESVVPDELPLVAGDAVGFHVDHFSCETHVLGTLPDGRVLIRGCRDSTRAEPVARSMLRVARYPVENAIITPAVGDVVLVLGGVGSAPRDAMRAVIVGLESSASVRVRPLRVAPSALAIDTHELVVSRARLLSVQRPAQAGAPVTAPLPEGPLAPGDRLRLRLPDGTSTRDVRVVPADAASPALSGESVLVAPFAAGELDGATAGAPFAAARESLEARVLRASDSVEAGAIVFERGATAGVATRAVVVRDTDHQEVCVLAAGSDPAAACHEVPKTALVCVTCPLE